MKPCERETQGAPQVSVLMPVFNTVKYVREAVDSIARQSFTDWELIIIDDGSTDGSTEVLRSLARSDPRIKLQTRENRGLIATRNELLQAACGKFIAWMDSDDMSLPDRLLLQTAVLTRDPRLTCVGSAVQCIDPEGHLLNVERYPEVHEEIWGEQSKGGAQRFGTTMARRLDAQATGGFRAPLRIGEDFDFLLRLGELGKLANLPDILYLYRQHIASVCAAMGPQWICYRDFILSLAQERAEGRIDRLQTGTLPTLHEVTPRERAHYESQVLLSWAYYSIQNGNSLLGVRYAFLALIRSPTSLAVIRRAAKTILSTLHRANS